MKRHWSLGLGTALAGHGLAVAAIIVSQTLVPPPKPVEAAIMIDLPPAAQPQPQPTPPAAEKAPPAPKQPPKPKVVKPRKVKAVVPSPAPVAPPSQVQPVSQPLAEPAPVQETAPITPPAPVRAADPQAIPNWQSLMLAHLERHKRYPGQAQSRRLRGVVVLTFTMDRSGVVRTLSVRDSSGHVLLDQAALDMLARAQPLPPPPPEVEGGILTLSVPVKFTLN